MEYRIQPFANIDDPLLEQLAALHQSVMHNLLTDLGYSIILRYYQIARSDPSVIGFYALSASREFLGWVVGSPDPRALNTRLQTPWIWLFGQMLRIAVTKPGVLLQMWLSVFHAAQSQLAPRTVELTYIGVAPGVQGNGIGRALLDAFTEASRSLGYCSMELSTEIDNLHALALYEKTGFAVKRIFKEGWFERYRMERKLSS
ncbi:MAG TPA: GNAT family N-acetyltransferase [Anaerolineales bacterium]|nr:GNAT family N-acetyltransferase [Anaerolineales bacterium]